MGQKLKAIKTKYTFSLAVASSKESIMPKLSTEKMAVAVLTFALSACTDPIKTSDPNNVAVKPNIWPTQFGTIEADGISGISTDSKGSLILGGSTNGSFPTFTNADQSDVFVTKYDSNGKQTWLKQFGTSGAGGNDFISDVAVDKSDNVIVAGFTGGEFNSFTNRGSFDVFIAKFDSSGKQIWLKQFGLGGNDYIGGVVTDGNGNIIVAGKTDSGFPGYFVNGGPDVFVVKFDSSGKQIWLKQFGTNSEESASGIAMDKSGNVFVSGITAGEFARFTNAGGGNDAFIVKLDPLGDQLWLKQFGTTGTEYSSGVAVDQDGNAFTTGYSDGAFAGFTSKGLRDIFAVKFAANGNQIWLKQFGTNENEASADTTVDASGNLILAGNTVGAFTGFTNSGGISADAFVTKYDTNGNQVWIKLFGTSGYEYLRAIAVDANENVFVAGGTDSAFQGFTKLGGITDAFINSFTANGAQR